MISPSSLNPTRLIHRCFCQWLAPSFSEFVELHETKCWNESIKWLDLVLVKYQAWRHEFLQLKISDIYEGCLPESIANSFCQTVLTMGVVWDGEGLLNLALADAMPVGEKGFTSREAFVFYKCRHLLTCINSTFVIHVTFKVHAFWRAWDSPMLWYCPTL